MIECEEKIIPARVIAIPKIVVNTLYRYFSHFNYFIGNIKTFEWYDKYKINFDIEPDKRIFVTKNVKENLNYIDKAFSNSQDFEKL